MNNIRTSYNARGRVCGVLTVDSDGNGLRENEAVGTLEGRDLAELVELQVVGRDTLGRLGLDELNVEAVLLCDSKERGGARVTLVGRQFWFLSNFGKLRTRGATYAVAVNLSERHDCWFTVGELDNQGKQRRWRKEKRLFGSKWGFLVFAFLLTLVKLV